MIPRLNHFFELLPERLVPWRWWVLLLYVILMSFLAAGIPRFAFTWANDDMFGKDDPVQISLDRIKDLFGGTVSLGMIYRPCLLYTSPSPRDRTRSRMPSSA